MRFSSVKKAMRLVLFTLLVGFLALFVTNGQVSAATYQANGTAAINQPLAAPPGCTSWNGATGVCYYWALTIPTTPAGCTSWDGQAQVCTAWTDDITYPTVTTYIYGSRYQCSSWNSRHHVCTHWKRGNNNFSRRAIHVH